MLEIPVIGSDAGGFLRAKGQCGLYIKFQDSLGTRISSCLSTGEVAQGQSLAALAEDYEFSCQHPHSS